MSLIHSPYKANPPKALLHSHPPSLFQHKSMSRRDRDGRQRHRSGFDREPSPKRSRRDGKPEAEREQINTVSDGGDPKRRRLQDALPLEESKVESGAVNEKKTDEHHERGKHLSDATDVPRSRSYFQHDERGRGLGRRATDEHRGRDSKYDRDELAITKKSATDDLGRQEERSQAKGDDRNIWKHDGFFKMEAEPAQAARKRPAFREKKIPLDSENTDKATTKPVRPGHSEYLNSVSDRRQERDRNFHRSDRSRRPVAGDGIEAQKRDVPSRERYAAGSGNQRGRDRFNGKQGYHLGDQRGGKWKHDLFDDANKSPTKKNEDDQIAKVEALLAS